MSSVYTNDLRLEEIGSGEQSGTWGDTTNTNLELIAEAFSFGTEAITTNADTHTTTIADGATDPGRSIYLKYTGTLDSACTITLGPNTVSKVWFIENATSGSQNIIISQGSGANVTIGNGAVKMVYSDGAGSGAAVTDALVDLDLTGTTTIAALTVSGAITGTTATLVGANTLTLRNDTSTDADEPKLIFDNDTFSGANHANITTGNGGLLIKIESPSTSTFQNRHQILMNGGAGDDIQFNLSTDNGSNYVNYFKIDGGNATFNETGADKDFRIESDGNANMLFVDGGNNNVGIGTNAPSTSDTLHVKQTSGNTGVRIETEGTNGVAFARFLNDARNYSLGVDTDDSFFIFDSTGSKSRFKSNSTETIINEDSGNLDFRVESDDNSVMFCVDGANNSIGVNTLGVSGSMFTISGPAGSSGSEIDTKAMHIIEGGFNTGNTFQVSDASSLSRFCVDGNGKVGVGTGTATIAAKFQVQDSSLPKISSNYNGAKHLDMGTGASGCGFAMTTGHFMTFNHQPFADRGTDTNLTERLRIEADGDLNVKTGNVIIETNGKGINFAGPTAAAGGTSQILDAYEEGTWTPALDGGSGFSATQSNSGTYTKIGRLVFVQVVMNISSYSQGSATHPFISGLPFTPDGGNVMTTFGFGNSYNTTYMFTVSDITGATPSGSNFYISRGGQSGTGNVFVQRGEVQDGRVNMALVYYT
jgi:hypothetical protein